MLENKLSSTLDIYFPSAFINTSSSGIFVYTSNPLLLNLSLYSPKNCLINSLASSFSIFSFIFPDVAFETSIRSSVNFFNF